MNPRRSAGRRGRTARRRASSASASVSTTRPSAATAVERTGHHAPSAPARSTGRRRRLIVRSTTRPDVPTIIVERKPRQPPHPTRTVDGHAGQQGPALLRTSSGSRTPRSPTWPTCPTRVRLDGAVGRAQRGRHRLQPTAGRPGPGGIHPDRCLHPAGGDRGREGRAGAAGSEVLRRGRGRPARRRGHARPAGGPGRQGAESLEWFSRLRHRLRLAPGRAGLVPRCAADDHLGVGGAGPEERPELGRTTP